MDNWTKLKNLYKRDHLSKVLTSPQTRLNALVCVEKLFQQHFPHIIQQPKFLKQIPKDQLMKEVELKKGTNLNSSEESVIHGLYKFLPEL